MNTELALKVEMHGVIQGFGIGLSTTSLRMSRCTHQSSIQEQSLTAVHGVLDKTMLTERA